jgi:hypothetical protein
VTHASDKADGQTAWRSQREASTMSEYSAYRWSIIAAVAAIGVAAVVWVIHMSPDDPGGHPVRPVAETTSSKLGVYSSYQTALLDEAEMIWEAGFIGRGRVLRVSASRWNSADNQAWIPTPVYATVEALQGMTVTVNAVPLQYYEVQLQVTDEWFNRLGVSDVFTFTVSGLSPSEAAMGSPLSGDSAESFQEGADVVVMLDSQPVLFKEGDEIDQIGAESGGYKYLVQPDGSLENPIGARTRQLRELRELVYRIKYGATPTT